MAHGKYQAFMTRWVFFKLSDRRASQLFLGHAVSLFGTSFSYIAFMQRFYELNGSSSNWVYIAVLKSLPFLLFGIYFGYLVDFLNRKLILSVCEIGRATIFLLLAFCNDLYLFYLLVFFAAVFDSAYEPAYKSAITSLLKKDEIFGVNSLEESTRSIFVLVGIGASGIALTWIGTKWCFILDACTYIFSAINLFYLGSLPKFSQKNTSGVRKLFRKEMTEGISVIRNDSRLYNPLLIWTTLVFLISFEAPMFFPLMAEKNWGGASAAGYVYAAVALGSLLTSFVIIYKEYFSVKSLGKLAALMLLDGICLLAFAQLKDFHYILFFSLLLGVTETVFRTSSISQIQEAVSEEKLGRVLSSVYMFHEPIKMISMCAAAFIVSNYSAQTGFQIAVLAEVAVAFLLMIQTFSYSNPIEAQI